jgi:dihydropyrimidine dehydrogenase (NADP+)
VVGRGLPKFGPFQEKRWKVRLSLSLPPSPHLTPWLQLQSEHCVEALAAPVAAGQPPQPHPSEAPPVVTVQAVVGKALKHIGNWSQFNLKEQVVAVVDEELCINCGKCCIRRALWWWWWWWWWKEGL